MAGIPPGKFASPNPKYPFVGPNYQGNGELAGYDYNPYTDKYRPNEEAAQNAGLLPKPVEQPGLLEQVMPIAVGLGTAEAAKGLGSTVGGMFGSGAAATATPGAALTGGAATGTGLLGSGTAAATPTTLVGSTALAPGGSSGLLGTAATTGMGSIGALPAAAIGLGLLAGAKGVKDLLNGKQGTSSLEGLAGRGTLGIATGGLSELARLAGVGRKSTKDYQDERWGALSEAAQGLRTANHPEGDDGIWDSGKYAGQKWDAQKALDLAKEDPTHFIGALGNLETVGDQWLTTPEEKQKQFVAELVAKNMYDFNKGDILISDGNKATALEIFNSIINPASTTPTATPMSPTGVIDPTKANPIDITRN